MVLYDIISLARGPSSHAFSLSDSGSNGQNDRRLSFQCSMNVMPLSAVSTPLWLPQ